MDTFSEQLIQNIEKWSELFGEEFSIFANEFIKNLKIKPIDILEKQNKIILKYNYEDPTVEIQILKDKSIHFYKKYNSGRSSLRIMKHCSVNKINKLLEEV